MIKTTSATLIIILIAISIIVPHCKPQDISLENYEIFSMSSNSETTENITLTNNVKFALKFSSNPTTGYDWYLSEIQSETTKELIIFLNLDANGGGDYISASTGLLGSGGSTYFLMETSEKNTGSLNLDFVYKRLWENDNIINEKTVSIQVI